VAYVSFWQLYIMLAPGFEAAREAYYGYEKKGGRADGYYVDPPVWNGPILGSACLGCALSYFAGGSPYYILVKYGLCYQDVLASVWIVIYAINTFPDFQITYPSSFIEQQKNSKGFKSSSTVGFDNSSRAIDRILIWMLKPTAKEAKKAGVGQKNFMWQEEQVWIELSSRIQRPWKNTQYFHNIRWIVILFVGVRGK
jgi:hypothetical protein